MPNCFASLPLLFPHSEKLERLPWGLEKNTKDWDKDDVITSCWEKLLC